MKKHLLLMLIALVGLAACKKDPVPEPNPGPVLEGPILEGSQINSSLGGWITDDLGFGMADVTVTLGNQTVKTDANGIFLIQNAAVQSNYAFVKAEKDGYFLGSRAYVPSKNGISYVKIQLLKKELAGTFSTADGATISVANKVKLTFEPNGIVNSDGTPFNGQVDVYARYLDPEAENLNEIMPGMLLGVNEDGNQRGLQTFGMTVVELYDDAGNLLQPANDKPVEMASEIPASLEGQAPATIPLWYFDEEMGIWVEEGSAELVNGTYVGKVAHFSFWNYDVPSSFIFLEGTIQWRQADFLAGYKVVVTNLDNSDSGFGYTDSEGHFGGYVPNDTPLFLEIEDLCGAVMYTANIGPFTSNTDLGTIILYPEDLNSEFSEVSGTLVDCDGNPLAVGYAGVKAGDSYKALYTTANGAFFGIVSTCAATEVEVTGYDLTTLKKSATYTFPVEEELDAGTIFICEDTEEFVSYTLDGEAFAHFEFFWTFTQPGLYTLVQADSNATGGTGFHLLYGGTAPGTYQMSECSFNSIWSAQNVQPNIIVEVDEFGAVGEEIIGTFDGDFIDDQGNSHDVIGSFKVIRDN